MSQSRLPDSDVPPRPAAPVPPSRGARIVEGGRTVLKAIWFLFSLLLYALGLLFLVIGRALIRISTALIQLSGLQEPAAPPSSPTPPTTNA